VDLNRFQSADRFENRSETRCYEPRSAI
jgi:hypothetical protein